MAVDAGKFVKALISSSSSLSAEFESESDSDSSDSASILFRIQGRSRGYEDPDIPNQLRVDTDLGAASDVAHDRDYLGVHHGNGSESTINSELFALTGL